MRQSKRVIFSRFVLISIESGTNTLAYAKPCEDSCQKDLEKAGRAKIVRNRAKRAKIRAKKKLEKALRAKIRAKKPSCEHFIQIPLSVEISQKKSPILSQNLHIQIFDRKSHGFVQKNLNILVSDRKPPEFALKSVYWIF